VRDKIKEAFETMGCFLLPHPGTKMTKTNYQGEIGDLEENFKNLLDRYVRHVFEEQLVPKRIQNKDVNSSSLELYIQQYANVFKEGRLPEAIDLVGAIALASNLSAKEAALEHYRSEMKAVRTGGFVGKSNLLEAHEQARTGALNLYDDFATFGDDAGIEEYKSQTVDKIHEEFLAINDSNELMMHQELQHFIFPLVAAVLAFVLDKISDYTCDSWSATCRDLSGNFAKLYYLVFLALALKFAFMYHKSGLLVASSGFMKLGHATLEKLNSIKEHTHALKEQAQGRGAHQDERKKRD
jgi:atlastin